MRPFRSADLFRIPADTFQLFSRRASSTRVRHARRGRPHRRDRSARQRRHVGAVRIRTAACCVRSRHVVLTTATLGGLRLAFGRFSPGIPGAASSTACAPVVPPEAPSSTPQRPRTAPLTRATGPRRHHARGRLRVGYSPTACVYLPESRGRLTVRRRDGPPACPGSCRGARLHSARKSADLPGARDRHGRRGDDRRPGTPERASQMLFSEPYLDETLPSSSRTTCARHSRAAAHPQVGRIGVTALNVPYYSPRSGSARRRCDWRSRSSGDCTRLRTRTFDAVMLSAGPDRSGLCSIPVLGRRAGHRPRQVPLAYPLARRDLGFASSSNLDPVKRRDARSTRCTALDPCRTRSLTAHAGRDRDVLHWVE